MAHLEIGCYLYEWACRSFESNKKKFRELDAINESGKNPWIIKGNRNARK